MNPEGVIKYQLALVKKAPLRRPQLAEIAAWRQVLLQLQVLGQTPQRYNNDGFGNLSRRLEPLENSGSDPFVISGTQTGGLAQLTPHHFATVLHCFPAENRVLAEGPIPPSSEAMTHGMVYALNPDVNWVFHAHEPTIWHQAKSLDVPTTRADVGYGTPEMSAEVRRLFAETAVRKKGIFAMAGHEDGIVTFGKTAAEAGQVLIDVLAQAWTRAMMAEA